MIPTQRWNTIRNMRLQWHFGYGLWPKGTTVHKVQLRSHDPIWDKAWKIMSEMEGLYELFIHIEAYLKFDTLSPEVEADILAPLQLVTVASNFVVMVPWQPNTNLSGNSTMYRLERHANRSTLRASVQLPRREENIYLPKSSCG